MSIDIIKDFRTHLHAFTAKERLDMVELLTLAAHPETKSGLKMYYWTEAQKCLGVMKQNIKQCIEKFIERGDLTFSKYVDDLRLLHSP